MNIDKTVTQKGFRIFLGEYKGKEALLVESGMGKARVEKAMNFILETYPVSHIVSFGFAGALAMDARIGDVYVCPTVFCDESQSHPPHHADPALITQCKKASAKSHEGKIVTSAKPALVPEGKGALAEASHCDVVDMESYWVAGIAAQKNIPFLSVRAISDTARDTLPRFDYIMDSSGRWLWQRTISYFISHPAELARLFKLYGDSNQARKNLTDFIDKLVENI